MHLFKSFKMIFTIKTLIVVIASIVSTFICSYYEFYANFPLTLIGVAVVFPIVFSINSAYIRRETALTHYGSMKAHSRALFLATRDWVPKSDKRLQRRLKIHLYEFLLDTRKLVTRKDKYDIKMERTIYSKFSDISLFIEELRQRGLPTAEVSRMNQYLSKIMESFENLKHIYEYRTPITLRAYSKVFIFVLPVFYGPYFAFIGTDFYPGLVYTIPILFSIILVSLDNIQDHLENPFDLIGEDDVNINAEKFIDELEP